MGAIGRRSSPISVYNEDIQVLKSANAAARGYRTDAASLLRRVAYTTSYGKKMRKGHD
jgi:hypothetical protein